ncbi:hypothetical protein [Burkholderia stagnalis]
MPINWSSQSPVGARGTADARPTRQDRGLSQPEPAPDESALEQWAKLNGYALDFTPRFDASTASRPTQARQGLKAPPADVKSGPPRKPAPQAASKPAKQQPATRKPGFAKGVKPAPAPRVVSQSGENTCWAAALESWLASANPARLTTQAELLKTYNGRDQSFIVENFRHYVTTYGMNTAYMDLTDFSADHIRSMLNKYGVLYIGYFYEKTSKYDWWHDVVLYDVTLDRDGEPVYQVMNPSESYREAGHRGWMNAGLQTWDKRHFFPVDSELVIGWRRSGGGPGIVY